ncbi:hypothetical protein D0864_14186, partial [Hortaea werneckii]
MVNKILFWSGFGLAVRFWQLGIEMRPFFSQPWAYPIYGCIGASFGYWMQGVEHIQMRYLRETRDRLLEKRRRRAEREQGNIGNIGSEFQKEQEGLFASPKVLVERGEHLPNGT